MKSVLKQIAIGAATLIVAWAAIEAWKSHKAGKAVTGASSAATAPSESATVVG